MMSILSRPATRLVCPRPPSSTCLRSLPSPTGWSSRKFTTPDPCSTPRSSTSLMTTSAPGSWTELPTWPPFLSASGTPPWLPPPRSPSRRLRWSRLSWKILTLLPLWPPQLPPLLLALLHPQLPPLRNPSQSPSPMTTWEWDSSTRRRHDVLLYYWGIRDFRLGRHMSTSIDSTYTS